MQISRTSPTTACNWRVRASAPPLKRGPRPIGNLGVERFYLGARCRPLARQGAHKKRLAASNPVRCKRWHHPLCLPALAQLSLLPAEWPSSSSSLKGLCSLHCAHSRFEILYDASMTVRFCSPFSVVQCCALLYSSVAQMNALLYEFVDLSSPERP